jgi:uncharacterized delta-60 repeat protein
MLNLPQKGECTVKHLLIITFLFCSSLTTALGQSGSLDAAFGDNGHTLVDPSAQNRDDESAVKVLIQSDGKRVVLVDRSPYIQLIRINADGSYDDSFGEGGFSQAANLSLSGTRGSSAALQSDGKIVATGETDWNINTLTDFGLVRWNTDGTLDASFGTQGMVTTNFGYWEEGMIVRVQADGKILVAGETDINSVTYLAFARYNSDGSPDSSFGFNGKHVNPIFSDVELIDMELTADGKLMVLGDKSGPEFVLARFLSTGPIDVGFTTDGFEEYDWGGPEYPFMDVMEIQSDGKLVLGGTISNGVNYDMLVARYNANGTIDNTFHGDGKQTTHIGGHEDVFDLAIQPDGMIVAAGRVYYFDLPTVFALARYETDGDLDETFGVQGTQITSFGGYEGASATTVALHSDGDITAAGRAFNNFNGDVAIATYDVQGLRDVDGYPVQQVTAFYADDGATILLASAVQTDGKLVGAGYVWNGFDFDFLIARFNTDGTLDQGFGSGGYQTTEFIEDSYAIDYAQAVAIQPDGKIVVSGEQFGGGGGDVPVARYNPDGTPDSSFDSDGKVLIDFPGVFEEGNSIVIQPDGKIVIGGSTNQIDFDFALCRLNSNGSLDGGFGAGGIVTTTFGYQDIIYGLALQPDGKILATGNTSLPNGFEGFDYCTVRYKTDGSVDSGFGTNGRVTTDFDGGLDFAAGIARQPDGKIVVVGGAPVNDQFVFGVVRYSANGVPDSGFGNSGKQTTAFNGYDIANAVAIENDGRIVVAGFTGNSNFNPTAAVDVALARYNANGTPDGYFGGPGTVTSDFGGIERATSLGLFNNRIYAAGYKILFREFTATDKYFGLGVAYVGGPPPADEQLDSLTEDLGDLPIPPATKSSLNGKLQKALAALDAGDTNKACNQLRAFVNEVKAQAGKKLTLAQAAKLVADAAAILSAIGCPLNKEGVDEMAGVPPSEYSLYQNHPNPFNPTTVIQYSIPNGAYTSLKVYDVLGREVATLVDEFKAADRYEVLFDASNLPSGLYLYRIQSGKFVSVKKMILAK